MFDKSSVTINDTPYYFAAYPPRIEKEEDAHIALSVQNTTETSQAVKIFWKLYRWDAMNPENLIREFETDVGIAAHASEKISVQIPEKIEPVYFLIGELRYQDTKSVVNIRYVRDSVDKVRLNFPAITSYPLKK